MTLTASLNYDCHEASACLSTWIPFSLSWKSLIVDSTDPKEGPEVGVGLYIWASFSVVNTQENEESQQAMADWMSYCSEGVGEQDFFNFSAKHVDKMTSTMNWMMIIDQLSASMFHNMLCGSVWRLILSSLVIVFLKTHHTSQPIWIFPKNE